MRISKLEARKFHFLKHNFSECFVVVIVVGFCWFFCCFWCCLSSESSLLGFFNLGARKFIFPKYMKNIFLWKYKSFFNLWVRKFHSQNKRIFFFGKMQEIFSQWIFLFSELGLKCAPGGHEVYYSNFFHKKTLCEWFCFRSCSCEALLLKTIRIWFTKKQTNFTKSQSYFVK